MTHFKQDEFGFWFTETLPENTKVATREDFIYQGKLIFNLPYLLYSYKYKIYECNRMRFPETFQNIQEFIETGRVYVFTDKKD